MDAETRTGVFMSKKLKWMPEFNEDETNLPESGKKGELTCDPSRRPQTLLALGPLASESVSDGLFSFIVISQVS